MEMFETAARKKYRFPYKGHITTEDLWGLTPPQLDSVYKALMQCRKSMNEDSLSNQKEEDGDLTTMIDIVKHVYTTKQEEAERRRKAAENARKRQEILEVLAEKKNESLRSMSEEDLIKLLDQMM